jgi:hypothetical protein
VSRARNTLVSVINRLDICTHGFSCTVCCWPWTGYLDKDGYGLISYKCKARGTSRIIFCELNNIPLDENCYICHTCDNPPCGNWSHLYKGNAITNNNDTVQRGRGNRVSGEMHHQSKLSWDQVKEARRLFEEEHYSKYSIAKLYRISQSQMQRILTYKKWNDTDMM